MCDEGKEKTIVSLSNTCSKPDAVVVKFVYAVITDIAVV
jgi:hypothetical protein